MIGIGNFINRLKEKLILRASIWTDKVFFFFAIHLLTEFKNNDTVLIFRLDNIGDYVLFRNYLPLIKNSPRYQNKKIVLVGNQSWASLALTFDSHYFDEALFIDRNRFYRDIPYKVAIIRKVRKFKAAEAVNTVHSRTSFTDQLVRLSGANSRITCEGDNAALGNSKGSSDKFYDNIIPSLPASKFEFYRNQFFFKMWLGSSIEINKPDLSIGLETKREKIIGIFPGASEKFRQWDIDKFSKLVALISGQFPDYLFYIFGSKKEDNLSTKIIDSLPNIKEKLFDWCGKTELPELVEMISKLELLITNDSAGLHISIATNTPAICISNGNHFGRFTPYPKSIEHQNEFIYPLANFYDVELKEKLVTKFQRGSNLDINIIEPMAVFDHFLELRTRLYE